MRWQELFDLAPMISEKTVIEYEDFKAMMPTIDIAIVPAVQLTQVQLSSKGSPSSTFAGFAKNVQDCAAASGEVQKVPQVTGGSSSGRKLVFSGYCDGDVQVKDMRCALYKRMSKNSLDELLSQFTVRSKDQAVLLKHLDGFGGPGEWGQFGKKQYQAFLRPAAPLKRIANKFTKRTLGKLPYLSVHLRRNEFVRLYPASVPSADAAAARLNVLLKSYNLEQVFVYTDGRPSFREELRALVKAPLYYFDEDDGAPTMSHAGQVEVVCLQLLAEGRVFIGTENSAFSKAVRRERAHLGLEKSSGQVFCANLTEEAAETKCI